MWETSEQRAAAKPCGVKYLFHSTSEIPQGQELSTCFAAPRKYPGARNVRSAGWERDKHVTDTFWRRQVFLPVCDIFWNHWP